MDQREKNIAQDYKPPDNSVRIKIKTTTPIAQSELLNYNRTMLNRDKSTSEKLFGNQTL